MHTLYPSGSETALDKDAVAKIEELLQTRFFNIAGFLALEDSQRTFEKLIADHSILVAKHMDGSGEDHDKYPLCVFPQLEIFIIEKLPDINSYVEFKVNGKRYEVVYDNWPDYSRIFVEINKRLTDFEFAELEVSYVENNVKYGNDVWFLVPTGLDADKLCSIMGYSATRPLEGRYSLNK